MTKNCRENYRSTHQPINCLFLQERDSQTAVLQQHTVALLHFSAAVIIFFTAVSAIGHHAIKCMKALPVKGFCKTL
jgi:hypothetical protein